MAKRKRKKVSKKTKLEFNIPNMYFTFSELNGIIYATSFEAKKAPLEYEKILLDDL